MILSIIIVGVAGTHHGVSPTTIGAALGVMAGTTTIGTMVGDHLTIMVAGTLLTTTIILVGIAIHVLRTASPMAPPQVANHAVEYSIVQPMTGDVV